jgi:predicted DNA-binding transcriptional regulator AlpA
MRQQDAMAYLGISRSTLYRLRNEGLPWHLLRGSVVYLRQDLDRYLDDRRTERRGT